MHVLWTGKWRNGVATTSPSDKSFSNLINSVSKSRVRSERDESRDNRNESTRGVSR